MDIMDGIGIGNKLFLLSTKVNSCDLRHQQNGYLLARSNLQIILKESGNGEALFEEKNRWPTKNEVIFKWAPMKP